MINYGQTKDEGTERIYGSENLDNGEKTRQNTSSNKNLSKFQRAVIAYRKMLALKIRNEIELDYKAWRKLWKMEKFYG